MDKSLDDSRDDPRSRPDKGHSDQVLDETLGEGADEAGACRDITDSPGKRKESSGKRRSSRKYTRKRSPRKKKERSSDPVAGSLQDDAESLPEPASLHELEPPVEAGIKAPFQPVVSEDEPHDGPAGSGHEEDLEPCEDEAPAYQKPEKRKAPRSRKASVKKAKRMSPSPGGSPLLNREILVSAASDETRVAVVEDGVVVEFYVERPSSQKTAGSIFLGRVMNVLPGMQAAFIDIGEEKNAFLYVDDALLPPNLDDSDEEIPVNRKRHRGITDIVKQGQEIMVQVVKEAIGTKGARVTRHVTFPGRYLVLMPTVSYTGVSRRITDENERQRLRKIARSIKPKDMGLIIRTVALGKSEDELKRDLDFLLKMWERVRKKARSSNAPALIHQDLGLVFRVVRDELNQSTTRMLVDDVHIYGKILDLLDSVSPEMKDRVIFYRDREYPLFQLYGVEAAIDKALQRQVWLKSGGYLVIDKTEALTVMDVNTGRYVGNKNLSDTVFKINIEACKEIARQLRLRDIGGIIVVDFIDMDVPAHRQKLIEELEKELKHDHTKTVVVGLTGLGLVELTRKKVRQSIDANMMRMCPYCGGKGTVMSEETVAARVRREIRRVLANSSCEAILVEVNPSVASHLIGPGGQNLKELEKETGRNIFIRGSEGLHLEEMNVKAIGTKEEIAEKAIPVRVGDILEVLIEEPHDKNRSDGIARREGYVIDVEGAGGRVGEKVLVRIVACHRTYAKAHLTVS